MVDWATLTRFFEKLPDMLKGCGRRVDDVMKNKREYNNPIQRCENPVVTNRGER
jgi:hypothetical protein